MRNKYARVLVKVVFLLLVLAAWEIIASSHVFGRNSELVFPRLGTIGKAFIKNFETGYAGVTLWKYTANSMNLLLQGLLIGVLLSFVMTGLCMVSKLFSEIYNLIVSIFDLIPGVALLPVVIVICGVKPSVIVLLVVHAVLWPMSRNVMDGFNSVPAIYVEAGRNIGMNRWQLLTGVYVPAATSYIISGLKVGWARAWRGLLSAEMIFGIASAPGIGLYINQMRTNMNNAEMYATLVVIILIGLVVQYGILAPIENHTIRKWGMSK